MSLWQKLCASCWYNILALKCGFLFYHHFGSSECGMPVKIIASSNLWCWQCDALDYRWPRWKGDECHFGNTLKDLQIEELLGMAKAIDAAAAEDSKHATMDATHAYLETVRKSEGQKRLSCHQGTFQLTPLDNPKKAPFGEKQIHVR